MTIKQVAETLKKLISSHDQLCKLSEEKTNIIIEGSPEMLQQLLLKEYKYIRLLEQYENERQKEVEKWFDSKQLNGVERTITNMLENISDEIEQKKLEDLTIQLTNKITRLKQLEQLNKDLIRQSMQFVHMSLEMINPTINQINYGNKKDKQIVNRSVFDSEA